ncbi:MAG: hypothetical protein WCA46_24140 [Actinocatenispora sp.]
MTPQPGPVGVSPRVAYRDAVAALAGPLQDRIAALDRADHTMVTERRDIGRRTAASAARVSEADAGADAAKAAVTDTDRECTRLWREVRDFQGRRPVGDLPAPSRPQQGAVAGTLLAEAAQLLARARRGELRIALPMPMLPAMLVAGVLGALILFGVGEALLVAAHGMAGTEATAARIIAEIAFFASPVAGIPLGLMWLSRYGQPMAPRAFAVLLCAGLVVGCGLFGLLVR